MALCPKLQFFLKLYLHTQFCMSCSRRQSFPVHTVRAELAVGTVPAPRLQANRKLRGRAGMFPLSPRGRPSAHSQDAAGPLSSGWSPRVQSARRCPGPPKPAPLGPVPGAGSDPSRHISEQGQEPGAAGREPTPASPLTYSSPTTVKPCLTCVNDWAIDSQNNQTNFSLTTDSNQFFPPYMFLRRTCDWYFFRK